MIGTGAVKGEVSVYGSTFGLHRRFMSAIQMAPQHFKMINEKEQLFQHHPSGVFLKIGAPNKIIGPQTEYHNWITMISA